MRVGDFKNRDDAKKILPLIHKLGYKDAFPVKDIVNLYSK
ncbi:MAG: SPOR domain-containing protein [bacterium]